MKFIQAVHSQINQIRSFSQAARLYLIAIVIDGISYCGWSLFFNFYILQRGFDKDFLGLVNAMPSIGILLLGIPMGRLSDRIGRRWAMIIGATLSIISMCLQVILRDPLLILMAAFMTGAASSLYFLSQAPFMMKASDPHNRDLLFSLNFGLITLSGAVGSAFAGQLPSFFGHLLHTPDTSALAYRAVILTSMAISFLLLVPLLIMKEPPTKTSPLQTGQKRISMWGVVRQPITLKLALPNLLIGLGAAILMPYVNVFFAERFSVTNQVLGVLFGLSAMLTGIGSMIGPRLARKLGGKVQAVTLTQASSLVFLLLMGFTPWMALSAGAYLVRGMLMNMAMPLLDAFSMEQVDENQQGTVNSVRNLAWQFGWAVGPFLSGLVQERYGFAPLFVATCVLYGASTWLTWIFFHKKGVGAQPCPITGEPLPAEPFETMPGP
jgi:MFS family permease